MKRIWALALIMLLCAGCAPTDGDTVHSVGTEDGGGSGYGVSVQSVMKLSDFYGVALGSTRENNRLMLGTPLYSLGSSDTYALSDGSQVVLTYGTTGTLADTLYTDFESGKSYGLFDYLISIGVLHGTVGGGEDDNTPTTPDGASPNGGGAEGNVSVFSDKLYAKAAFDGKLSLYLDRSTVISTIGAPSSFAARQYKTDSYIIDHYNLDDGSVLMLDYGYDRESLRCAAIKGADGVTSGYLGTWAPQDKPADFVRNKVELGQITSLKKGSDPARVYAAVGEPAWMEGKASEYRDVFVLSDGSFAYLSYSDAHSKLEGAYRVTAEGKLIEVSLR